MVGKFATLQQTNGMYSQYSCVWNLDVGLNVTQIYHVCYLMRNDRPMVYENVMPNLPFIGVIFIFVLELRCKRSKRKFVVKRLDATRRSGN